MPPPHSPPDTGAVAARHPAMAAIVDKLLSEHERYLGTTVPPSIVALTVRPRRLSDVAILDLAVASRPLRLFIKTHKKSRASIDRVREKAGVEFDTLRVLYERFAALPGYGVVRPVAFFPDELTVITEAADGDNLHQLIKGATPAWRAPSAMERSTTACRSAGRWLRHFQAITRRPTSGPLPHTWLLDGLRSDLAACEAFGLPRDASRQLFGFAEAQTVALGPRAFPVTGQHPDYQPDNVIVGPDAVTVLDFTSFQYGSPVSDVARFLSILGFLRKNPLHSRQRLQALAGAFLEGYGPLDADTTAGVALYVVLFVVKAVRVVPTWPRRRPLPYLMGRQAAAFLASWSRQVAASDPGRVASTIL